MKSVVSFPGDMDILRYPRLDTVLMVEGHIKEHDGEFRKRKLWEDLPRKMMYQTFTVIIRYLLYSRKIAIDAEGKIGWIHYPDLAQQWMKRKELGRDAIDHKVQGRKGKKSLLQARRRR